MTEVVVEVEPGSPGDDLVLAKFSEDGWEINVRALASEFLTLRDIRMFDWDTRRAVKVGGCAGANVFWCSDGKMATILVGDDDETWDIAVSVSVGIIDDLVRQVGELAI